MTYRVYLPAALLLILLVPLGLRAQSPAPTSQTPPQDARQTEIAQLVDVLRSDADDLQKIKACKRLALIGDRSVIAVVSPLLANDRLSHGARLVLEAIPDPEAIAALRNAIPSLKGNLLVGVINSLGARHDEKATGALGQKLADPDPAVAAAAGAALGRIATPEAAKLLLKATANSNPATRPALGDACLTCAEAYLAQGNVPQATAIFDELSKLNLPEPLALAAMRGAVLARKTAGIERLTAELQSNDEHRFAMAVGVSHELPASEVAPAVAQILPKASPQRQVSLVMLLRDLGEVSVRPAVLDLLKNPQQQVRAAAIRALSTLADPSALPVLYEAASQSDAMAAAAARDTLATINHPDVDAAVMAMFEKAEGKSRLLLIDLLGRRRIVAALPLLEKAADDPDEQIRLAAIRAMGQAADAKNMSLLVKRLAAAKAPQEVAAVHQALQAACARQPDKQACAEKLIAGLADASPQIKCILLDTLNVAGETTALAAVAAAINDANPEVRDTATRVLGNWPTPEAAAALLEAATKSADGKLRVRSLRGYIRIPRQLDISDHQRLQMCRTAMEAAERDDERRLVLDACTRVANSQSLAFVASHLDTPGLKDSACAATVSIAERLVSAEPKTVAEAVQRVLPLTQDAELTRRVKEVLQRAQGTVGATK